MRQSKIRIENLLDAFASVPKTEPTMVIRAALAVTELFIDRYADDIQTGNPSIWINILQTGKTLLRQAQTDPGVMQAYLGWVENFDIMVLGELQFHGGTPRKYSHAADQAHTQCRNIMTSSAVEGQENAVELADRGRRAIQNAVTAATKTLKDAGRVKHPAHSKA